MYLYQFFKISFRFLIKNYNHFKAYLVAKKQIDSNQNIDLLNNWHDQHTIEILNRKFTRSVVYSIRNLTFQELCRISTSILLFIVS